MPERIPPFDPGALEGEARRVYERIMAERGRLPGPYPLWLSAPGFADRIEAVERYLRHEGALDTPTVEVAVLVIARHWASRYVWTAHVEHARNAGIDQAAVDAIFAGDTPALARERDAVCHALCRALLTEPDVDDTLWARSLDTLGEAGVNEVCGLIGLYTTVCMTMKGYRKPTKSGEPDPFAAAGARESSTRA